MWGKIRHTKPKVTVDLNVLDFFTENMHCRASFCNDVKDAIEVD
jgi:hypothetical protein